jgi:hypothetical protein
VNTIGNIEHLFGGSFRLRSFLSPYNRKFVHPGVSCFPCNGKIYLQNRRYLAFFYQYINHRFRTNIADIPWVPSALPDKMVCNLVESPA